MIFSKYENYSNEAFTTASMLIYSLCDKMKQADIDFCDSSHHFSIFVSLLLSQHAFTMMIIMTFSFLNNLPLHH